MTRQPNKYGMRAAAAERRAKHAQRTPLPGDATCWNCGSAEPPQPAGVDGNGNHITVCAACHERQEEE